MATRAEIIADVYTLTKRPDQVGITDAAVRAATLKAHQMEYFPKDLVEVTISWNPVDYVQSLEYLNLFPTWRALKYLRKLDASLAVGDFFDIITPEGVLDEYQTQREDVVYIAGAHLQIKSSTQDPYMLVGYYKHPIVVEDGFDSWIAREFPFVIIYEAAAAVFKTNGYDEQANSMRTLLQEQRDLLRQQVIVNGF